MSFFPAVLRLATFPPLAFCFALISASPGWAQELAPTAEAADPEIEDVTKLPAFKVKGVQPEDFGFRYVGNLEIGLNGVHSYVMVSEVFPNSPAARAGLKPGDFILKVDGKSQSIFSKWKTLRQTPERKWAELESGKKNAAYSLEVRSTGATESHTVTMTIPSPAPHWGSEKWSAPEGRTPAVVKETGPLAAISREVLDNGIWSLWMRELAPSPSSAGSHDSRTLGYEWRIVQPSGTHRIWVTQQRGRTEIALEIRSPETGDSLFFTSPSGALDLAHGRAPKQDGKRREFSDEELRLQFQSEIDFWLKKVGRVTGRWPFEALTGKTEAVASPNIAKREPNGKSAALAASFLKLPAATPEQKALFSDALGKIGLDAELWAFTETSRSLEDSHLTTVRFDPSKPLPETSALLKVDGKEPKAAYLQQWRSEGRGALPGLGELPALSSIVDLNDVRIFSDETTAVVFELPVKTSGAGFPADKFQARFRVNKTSRGFEDFSVKLREPMSVAGIAKVTDAGLEARFQSFDPALAPQPVLLKMGGGVRVLLVKVSRTFEVTRTDFKKVVPFENQNPEKPAP